jgi:hypothetical protein
MAEKSAALRWSVSCMLAFTVSSSAVACGGRDSKGERDGGAAGGGDDGGPIPSGSDVYLTCKLNGESVRIEGAGTVVANYQVKDDETVLQTGGPQKYRFLFIIPGKSAGSWKLGDRYSSLSVTDVTNMTIWQSGTSEASKGATLQVELTSYGNVGGYVAGTFSGTAVNISDGSALVITEGVFHALRIADVTG